MLVAYSPLQQLHQPGQFMAAGQAARHPDVPARVQNLHTAVAKLNFPIIEPRDHGLKYVSRVHEARYLDFLQHAFEEWSKLPNKGSEVLPNVHPRRAGAPYPHAIIGRAGYHLYDMSCAIGKDTWTAMLWGAHSAAEAAAQVRDGAEPFAYALCRSPGHHAGPDYAGGFCYLNGTAVAADVLRERYARVAIVDVDVHHGNGTQDIFYGRDDIFTVSLHGDTGDFYPYYWGTAAETGEGDGAGFNLNIPLARHTGDDDYLRYLGGALARVRDWGAEAVVVALGFDAYINDPLAYLDITTDGFSRIAAAVAGLGLPTVFVQEGGYMCEDLGKNLSAFMTGFESTRAVRA